MGNTTTTNNKKKKSNARKLIPAIGMLMTSAAMLTTSTYAWFTMNREVSITGISLTASVPETLEISLGSKSTPPQHDTEGQNHYKIDVTPPVNDDTGEDWSNSVDMATYYNVGTDNNKIKLGKLVPVSSVNGANMFFTDDAIKDGRELAQDASFLEKTSEFAESNDGTRYYIDIPVWFRSTALSSGDSDMYVNLKAAATIIGTGDNTQLYRAARVSILKTNNNDTVKNEINGGVMMKEAPENSDDGAKYNDPGKAISSESGERTAVTVLDSNTEVVSVPKRTSANGANHGEMVKMIARVWLEGEDYWCYNPNAGQSFTISINFSQDIPNPSQP